MADLPYGRSAPVFLTRGGKQGDNLSQQLFNLLFFALLLGRECWPFHILIQNYLLRLYHLNVAHLLMVCFYFYIP